MFTGIVQELATVVACDREPGLLRLHLGLSPARREGLVGGASVAVNGICLTVARQDATGVGFDVIEETLETSSLGELAVGDPVNVERSATFADEIRSLAESMMDRPEQVDVAPRNSATELVEQKVYRVDSGRKAEALIHLVKEEAWDQCLVFTRTKHGANRLAEKLNKAGVQADAIHGNKSQSARTRALSGFKNGTVRVLVATDIAARGLDIDALPHVVNFELPNVAEDYVHRIGRTGRAGTTGIAVSLVSGEERKLLRDIERLLKRDLEGEVIPGFEPDPNARHEPLTQGRRGSGGGGGGQRRGGGGGGNNRGGNGGQRRGGGNGGNRGGNSGGNSGGNGGGNRRPRRPDSGGNRRVA